MTENDDSAGSTGTQSHDHERGLKKGFKHLTLPSNSPDELAWQAGVGAGGHRR
ncbi:hypothetical protein [Trinickia acidisoli]|uniref:hypothetical protein n=1 Tax=Trinickia acidisoli TaxID=2767482 RepID=UPI001A8C6BED|nr:hypothetical protein [Trinickia acidisoli]